MSISSRREFLKTQAVAALAVTGGVAAAGARSQDGPGQSRGTARPYEMDNVSIAQLQEGLTAGKWTAVSLCEKYLTRIEEIDRSGPTLKSVIEINPDSEALAKASDAERQSGKVRGPLHGIPILLKDNIDTGDRMSTTAGSLALVGAKPPGDAFLVRALREAGAIILGKTNLSEWANIRNNPSTSGWSARGGLTRNPYALDRNTSGSSSGSGAAVAAGLCAAAVGTETDGSIVSPSSINGIVGIKPTVGLISRTGVIPISHTQDTAGPMAQCVRDAALLLGAMAGHDPEDGATGKAKEWVTDYTPFLKADGLKGARIGVARNYFGAHEGMDAVMAKALELMKSEGAILVDPAELPNQDKVGEPEMTVLLYELKADMNAYLARLGPKAPVKTLEEVIKFNEKNRDKEMPYFGQNNFTKAQAKGPLTDKAYLDALEKCKLLTRTEGIDAVMEKHKLDALVAPTDGPAWVTDLIVGDRFLGSSSTAAAVAGYPSITVPAGFLFGLPIGISFFGRAWSEGVLLKLAFAYEQVSKARKPPRFLKTVEF